MCGWVIGDVGLPGWETAHCKLWKRLLLHAGWCSCSTGYICCPGVLHLLCQTCLMCLCDCGGGQGVGKCRQNLSCNAQMYTDTETCTCVCMHQRIHAHAQQGCSRCCALSPTQHKLCCIGAIGGQGSAVQRTGSHGLEQEFQFNDDFLQDLEKLLDSLSTVCLITQTTRNQTQADAFWQGCCAWSANCHSSVVLTLQGDFVAAGASSSGDPVHPDSAAAVLSCR